MSELVPCTRCGAVMVPEADGRTFGCAFCGSRMQVAIGADQIARGMAVDLSNLEGFVARVANALSQGFAEHTQIRARGRVVDAIDLVLEPDHFALERQGQSFVAKHKKVVRGIALRTATLPLDVWFDKLTEALATHANQNSRAAWVLSQLGGPR